MNKMITKILISIGIGLVFLVIWWHWIDFPLLVSYFSKINVKVAILAFIFYIFSYFIRSYRWRLLLSTSKKIKQKDAFSYLMAGNFINYLIPIRAGEVTKCLFIKKNYGIPMSQSFPSVFIDKLFDMFGIFVIIILIPLIPINLDPYLSSLIFLLIFVFFFGASVLIFATYKEEKVITLLQKMLFFFPKKYKIKIHDFIELFIQGTAIFKNHINLLLPCILLTLCSVVCDSLFFWSVFKAFSQKIDFVFVLFGYTLIFLSYILPHPPAQIGSNELIMVLIFSVGFGYSKEMVSAVMTFSHLITGIIVVTVGMLGLSYAGFNLIDFLRNGDKNESRDA